MVRIKVGHLFLLILILAAAGIFFTPRIVRRFCPTRPPPGPQRQIEIVKKFSFSTEADLKEWQKKVLSGHVKYTVTTQDDISCVDALSEKAASAMYYKIKMDPCRRPSISWKWSAMQFPAKKKKEDLSDKKEDDFAARVYVIFPAPFFTSSKILEYIWANEIPAGTIMSSPYTNNIKLFVLRSGDASGAWFAEERDIYGDYVKAFGEAPDMYIGAVSFMTDADSTGTTAHSRYADIILGYIK